MRQAGISSRVAGQFGLYGHQGTIPLGPGFHADHRGVPLGVSQHRLDPVVQKLDWPAGGIRQQRSTDLAGDVLLAAKSTADERASNSYLFVAESHGRRGLGPVGVGDLRADIHGQLGMVGIVAGRHADAALWLHEHVVVGGRPILTLHDDVCLGKSPIDVAMPDFDVLQQVAGLVLFVDQRGIWLSGLLGAGHHRQRFVFGLNERQGFPCNLRRVSRDDGHRVTQVADLVVAQRRPVLDDQPMPVAAGHVLVRQHGVHAGQCRCAAGVNGKNPGVRILGAQRGPVEHAGEDIVIGELGRACDFFHGVRPRVGTTDDAQRFNSLNVDGRQRLTRLELVHRRLHRAQNAGIARAAAGVPAQGALDLLIAGL